MYVFACNVLLVSILIDNDVMSSALHVRVSTV